MVLMGVGVVIASARPKAVQAQTTAPAKSQNVTSATITTIDDVVLYYKDWGPKSGPVVTLSHGWPLDSDSWKGQAFFLASQGFRVITHGRRGHGRFSQPWNGNDMDHYADDLATVIITLNLKNIAVMGFSTGGGEVARYIGRHGTSRVSKICLISAVPPLMLKTDANPGASPIKVFDGIRAGITQDRSQLFIDIPSGPFYGFNHPGAKPSQGMINSWWMQGMVRGFKNTFDTIKAFSEKDFTQDLKKFDKPTFIIHGDDDQIVPIDAAGRASKRLVPNATLKVYPGAPHGLTETHREQLNKDLLAFLHS
ncbi:alpha/beta fold hydrolase [Pseudomonas fluorescens]|uniref:alpha/beta fold hydrolase n=1 Tax=Pseudomonas fluorescens TaxID=294 RepID=UPI003F5A6386